MVGAEHPRSGRPAAARTGWPLRCAWPASPSQWARLLRAGRVAGWSGPSTPVRSSSSLRELGGRFLRLARLAQPGGQVAAGAQGGGVVGAEHPGLVVQQLRELGGRFLRPARLAQPGGQVAADGEGGGVVGAEHPLVWSASSCSNWVALRCVWPASPSQEARLPRAARVSGWSGPSTRTRSASSCANWVAASAPGPPRLAGKPGCCG